MLQNKEQLKEGFYLEGNRDFVRPDPRYDKYGFQTRMPLISAFLYFVAGFWHFKRKCHTTSSCFQVVQLPPLPCTTQPPNFWQVTVYEQKNSCSTQKSDIVDKVFQKFMKRWTDNSRAFARTRTSIPVVILPRCARRCGPFQVGGIPNGRNVMKDKEICHLVLSHYFQQTYQKTYKSFNRMLINPRL